MFFIKSLFFLKITLIFLIGLFISSKRFIIIGVTATLILPIFYMLLNPLINVARTHEFSILNKTDLYSKLIILNDSIKFLTFYENDPGLSLMFKKNIILAEFDLSYYENKNKKKMKEVIKSIKSSQITDKKIDNLFDKINKK